MFAANETKLYDCILIFGFYFFMPRGLTKITYCNAIIIRNLLSVSKKFVDSDCDQSMLEMCCSHCVTESK